MLVSVVVPIYNPGRYFHNCIASLLAQSMPSSDYEIVLVDDGSTDETPALLDQLAADHDNVRVFHEENSGWAGRPRNIGIDQARGEYVQFVDQDDELNVESLQRLYAIARRNSSDIVLGKVGGTMQGPSSVFARTVERCTVETAKLFDSLPPHKMFRRQFLIEEDIRFPEGRVRLEDQLFMAKAYLRAEVVSIVGDYVCYFWMRRDDGGNTSARPVTPRDYFGYLDQVLQLVTDETEPGPRRDDCLRRFFRVEMMTRVREPNILQATPSYRQESYEVVREMALARFGPPSGVIPGLPATMRLRAHLLMRGRLDSLITLAQRQNGDVRGRTTVQRVRVQDGKCAIRLTAELTHRDGRPVVVVAGPKGYLLDPAFTSGLRGVPKRGWPVGNPLDHTQLEFRVHDEAAKTAWFPPTKVRPTLQHVEGDTFKVVIRASVVIDPKQLGQGLAPGSYDVKLRFQMLGHGPGNHPVGPTGPLKLVVGPDGTAASVPAPSRLRRIRSQLLVSPTVRAHGSTVLQLLPPRMAKTVRRSLTRVR
jgi:glycosyltransferase involved in cell wall biosynthesis